MNIAENIGKTRNRFSLTNRRLDWLKEKLKYTHLKLLYFSEILETKHNATCRQRKTPKTISGEILAYGQRQEAVQYEFLMFSFGEFLWQHAASFLKDLFMFHGANHNKFWQNGLQLWAERRATRRRPAKTTPRKRWAHFQSLRQFGLAGWLSSAAASYWYQGNPRGDVNCIEAVCKLAVCH